MVTPGDDGSLVRGVRLIVILVAIYLVVSIVSSRLFVFFGLVGFDPAPGLVIPFSLLFGVFGAISGAAGVLIRDTIHGSVTGVTLITGAFHLMSGYLAFRLWGQLGIFSTTGSPTIRSPTAFLEYVIVTIVCCAVAAAGISWGNEILAVAPFYLAAVMFVQYVVSTVTIGTLFLYVSEFVLFDWIEHLTPNDTHRASTRFGIFISVVALLWLALGIVGSIGFRNAARIPSSIYTQYGIGFITPLVDPVVFGHGAVRAHVIFGAVMSSMLLVLLLMEHRTYKDSRMVTTE